MKIGSLLALIMITMGPANGQSLFESYIGGYQEKLHLQSLSLGGFIRSVAYLGNTHEDEVKYFQSIYGQVSLQLEAKAGEWASGRADIRFKYGNEFHQSVSEMEIREVYVDVAAGPTSLRIGKLITPWGKGTVINPTEKITPLDPTVRSPYEDDMYLGVWAMQGRINLGASMSLTGTWKPLYQSSVLLIDPLPKPDYVNFLDPVLPRATLSEGSYGLNYDLHSRLADASLYWFDGYHHWPGIGFDAFKMDSLTLEPAALNIRQQPYRIKMMGLDLSIPVGFWIMRAEGAWQKTNTLHDELEYMPLPEISYTVEIERSGSRNSVLVGYYGKYIIEHTPTLAKPSLSASQDQFTYLMQLGIPITGETIDEMIREQIGAFNRLYNYQLEKTYHSVFFIWKGNFWYERVELTILMIYNITTEELIFHPGVSYTPSDGIKILMGLNGLYGPENSLYDLVGPVLNAGYLSLTITF